MPQLDAVDDREAAFLAAIESLPDSYDGPDGVRPEPYGLIAFGEAANLPALVRSWIDAPLVTSGTQFLAATGFDFGELGPLKITSEMSGAEVVTVGSPLYEPDVHVPAGPFSLYTVACYVGYATDHGDAVEQINDALRAIAERCRARVQTEVNPAKALAWTLWNRVPLLLASRSNSAAPPLVQRVFARIGKSLAISSGQHPLEFATGALEGNHALGDDLLALVLGSDDRETELARQVLATRVAQIESLDLAEVIAEPPADPVVSGMALWYLSLWVAAYLAILHGHDPADSGVYDEVRKVAQGG